MEAGKGGLHQTLHLNCSRAPWGHEINNGTQKSIMQSSWWVHINSLVSDIRLIGAPVAYTAPIVLIIITNETPDYVTEREREVTN